MIGRALTKGLCLANQKWDLHICIILLIRNLERAELFFCYFTDKDSVHFVVGNVENEMVIDEPVDYSVYGASRTASREFANHAVETIQTTVYGTAPHLRLRKDNHAKFLV